MKQLAKLSAGPLLVSALLVSAVLLSCASNPAPDTTEQDLRANKAEMMDRLDAQK
jgi:hypothetical protein